MITKKNPPTTDYHHLAPSADHDWVEAFVLEQRLLGVPGDRIGDALAVVESHVVESGERAQEAFGEAATYARETAAAHDRTTDLSPAWFGGAVLGLLGMMITLAGVHPLFTGEGRLEITLGWVAMLVLTLAGVATIVLASGPVLRFLVHRFWVAVGAFVVWFALIVVLAATLRQPVVEVPAVVAVVVGVALLVVGAALELREVFRGDVEDPVRGPGETAPRRRLTAYSLLTALLFPLATAVMVVVDGVVTAALG